MPIIVVTWLLPQTLRTLGPGNRIYTTLGLCLWQLQAKGVKGTLGVCSAWKPRKGGQEKKAPQVVGDTRG